MPYCLNSRTILLYLNTQTLITDIETISWATIDALSIRLIFKLLTPAPDFKGSAFLGQKFIAKLNHLLLYLTLLTVTFSGILKKLFNGESLVIFFKKINLTYNYELSEQFYSIHILANYALIGLITLHILAVLFHKFLLSENILKRIL